MSELSFIGREHELQALGLLLKKKTASLVVIQGRRRIGKSRLVAEFAKGHRTCFFTGLPPTLSTTEQSQRDEFSRQLSVATGLPEIKADDWSKLFDLLADKTRKGRVILFFDEISWMGSKDSDFLGKLKTTWDLHFKQNPRLILIVCGSISTWIEENILTSTGFMGRISLNLILRELQLNECEQFLRNLGVKASTYEKFKLLSVTGGIPRYLEEIQPALSAEENIKRLCFLESGILFREFNDIFSDLFSKRSETYKSIVQFLANGSAEFKDICVHLQLQRGGHLSEYLDDLTKSGFISRDYTWHLKTGVSSRLSHYRLSDNYLRFYLKYIEKNRAKIEHRHFENQSLLGLPGLEGILSLQFENLVLNNRKAVLEKLHIHPVEIVSDNPFFQRKTTKTPGCQIDYLIHTRFNVLYLCEIKFSKHELKTNLIEEMKHKLERLAMPKGFSSKPVLIHVNGVSEDVLESGFFSNVIDFSELLT